MALLWHKVNFRAVFPTHILPHVHPKSVQGAFKSGGGLGGMLGAAAAALEAFKDVKMAAPVEEDDGDEGGNRNLVFLFLF